MVEDLKRKHSRAMATGKNARELEAKILYYPGRHIYIQALHRSMTNIVQYIPLGV